MAPPSFVSEAHSSSDGCCGLEYNNTALTIDVTGTNRLLIAVWHSEWDGTPNPAPTPPDPEAWSVTNNGVPGTLFVESNGYREATDNRRFRIYYWVNPPLGENIVRVSNPNTGPNELAAAALLFNNVDQLDPLSVQVNQSLVARTSESETVSTALTDLVLHVIANGLDNVGTIGPGETSRAIVNDNFNKGDASLWLTTKPGEDPTTTVSSSGWADLILNAAAIVLHGNSTIRP